MSSSANDADASPLIDSVCDDAVTTSSEEEKPNRAYSTQILNAIEEINRDEWNALLDANSR